MTAAQEIKEQVLRGLESFLVDRNDEATRTRIRIYLESVITGSAVFVAPLDPHRPNIIQGSLSHTELSKPLHFEMKTPVSADICLACGESGEHVRYYGCVASVMEPCPYEQERMKK